MLYGALATLLRHLDEVGYNVIRIVIRIKRDLSASAYIDQ